MRGRRPAHVSLLALLSGLAAVSAPKAHDSVARATMNREEIIAAFVDQQLSGVYPSRVPWSELIRSDGTTDYREGQAQREGHWWMRADDFCFRYALPLSGGCFRVVRVGANCYELYAVSPSDAVTPPAQSAPGAPGHWNGRMWRDDASPTCEERPTS